MRLARFAWFLAKNNLLKYLLLSLLVTTGVVAFFMLSELSRASQTDIDTAVVTELGDQGVYTVEYSTDLSMSPADLMRISSEAVASAYPIQVKFVEIIPGINPECPPDSVVGEQSILVFREASGAYQIFAKEELGVSFDVCIGGQRIPTESIRNIGEAERRLVGDGFVVDDDYAQLSRLAASDVSRWLMIVNVGRAEDARIEIEEALWRAFEIPIIQNGLMPEAALSVNRVDEGESIRAASDGIRLVYSVISWMTLGLVAIGVLVAELFVVRDRMWLLGLSRAVGARRSDLAKLIVLDVFGIIFVGVVFAVLLSIGLSPAFESFGQSAFQSSLVLFRLDLLPLLLTFLVTSVALGAFHPALMVLRLDPAETVERR